MELALYMGMPVDTLARTMTEAELHAWSRYANRHNLPFRRLELMIAQMSALIARTGGAKNVKVSDFMLREVEEMPANVTQIDAARKAFGFAPRRPKAVA